MAEPDFEQIARQLANNRTFNDCLYVDLALGITDALRQVWNARGAADIAAVFRLCEDCSGTGDVLDAPANVLDGRTYRVPCESCGAATIKEQDR